MKKLIATIGYIAFVLLGISMVTTASAELSNPAENAGAFAAKFGLEIERAVLAVLCTFLAIYIVMASIALLIKIGHGVFNIGICGALSMLFDVLFCIIHGVILYALIKASASATAIIYLALLFGASLFALFSNGASISKPAGGAKK